MKVKELIAILEQHNPEYMVVVDGYEGGYSDPNISELELNLNVNDSEYFGDHEEGSEVSAICIGRN